MSPDPFIEAARMCATATGWLDRFKRYERLLQNTGMTEEDAEREVTAAYRQSIAPQQALTRAA